MEKAPDDLLEQYRSLLQQNQHKAVEVGRLYQRALDPMELRLLRMEHLLNILLPKDSLARVQAEISWQQRIQNNLVALEKECKENKHAGEKLWKPGSLN